MRKYVYLCAFILLAHVSRAQINQTTVYSKIYFEANQAQFEKLRTLIVFEHLAKSDKKSFYDEVSRATWGYLGDKLNIDMAELSKDNVEEKLLAKNAKADTISKLKNLLNTCELALYSPVGEGSEMKTNYDAAMNLIADLEDEVKS